MSPARQLLPRSNAVAGWRLAALVLVASCVGGCDASPDRPPNILLYVSDTLRADGLAPYGNTVVETPNVSRLAAEGTLYRRVYAPSSWTRPSITSILTGLHPNSHAVLDRADRAPQGLVFLPELLKAEGYRTAAITTNPNVGSFFGFDQGYDEFVELYARSQAGPVDAREELAPSDVVTQRAIDWIGAGEGPFFLFALATDPHWPYDPPPRFDRYGGDYAGPVEPGEQFKRVERPAPADLERIRSLYYGEIAFNDDSLGTLLDYLAVRGILDDTVVVFTSDHGEEFWGHGRNGHGHSLFEEVLRVPLVIRFPRAFDPGAEAQRSVEITDLFPTLLGLAGVEVPDDIDGRPLRHAPTSEGRAFYASLAMDGYEGEVLIQHPWKLERLPPTPERPQTGYRLYNLRDDPKERRNLALEQQQRVAAMVMELEARAALGLRRREIIARDSGEARVREIPAGVADALEALGYIE